MASNQLSPSTENCPPAAALLHHSLSSIHVFCHLLGARMEMLDSFLSGILRNHCSQRGCRHISHHTDVHMEIITQNLRHTFGKCSEEGSIQVLVQQNLVQLKMIISSPEKKRKARVSAIPVHPNGSELHLSRGIEP